MSATEVAYIWPAKPPASVTCPICGNVSDAAPIFMRHFQHVSDTHPAHWQAIRVELGIA